LASTVYSTSNFVFHSFAEGQANDLVVINYQSDDGDCSIGSYEVMYKDQVIIQNQIIPVIGATSSYFDSYTNSTTNQGFLVHLFQGYDKLFTFQLLALNQSSNFSVNENKNILGQENPLIAIFTLKTEIDAKKVFMARNPVVEGEMIVLLLSRK
jgi:hypothetical protein